MDIEGEFVTPTGAAIVAAVRTSEEKPSDMKTVKTGGQYNEGCSKETYGSDHRVMPGV